HAALPHVQSVPPRPSALVNSQVALPVVVGKVATKPRSDCGSALVQNVGKLEHEPMTVPMAMLNSPTDDPVGPLPLNVMCGGDLHAPAPGVQSGGLSA